MNTDHITLSMGSGGRASKELVEEIFLSEYGTNPALRCLDDSAELLLGKVRLAFTTDCYTVKPIFFPGGDIGKLSLCGTCNDLAVKGARPIALSVGFIIEEGFPVADLRRISRSIKETAETLGIQIVTGDTKVVNKGEADGIFITTAGIGEIIPGFSITASGAQKGDRVIVSGTIGDHGIAILNRRHGLDFSPVIQSDVAGIFPIVDALKKKAGQIHAMRDPTRGGLASVLNEIAAASRVVVRINEDAIPLRTGVNTCCRILGLDPLYIANEGKVVLFVSARSADEVLETIRRLPQGPEAAIIGEVEETAYDERVPPVYLRTTLKTSRFVPLLEAEPLPRIC